MSLSSHWHFVRKARKKVSVYLGSCWEFNMRTSQHGHLGIHLIQFHSANGLKPTKNYLCASLWSHCPATFIVFRGMKCFINSEMCLLKSSSIISSMCCLYIGINQKQLSLIVMWRNPFWAPFITFYDYCNFIGDQSLQPGRWPWQKCTIQFHF